MYLIAVLKRLFLLLTSGEPIRPPVQQISGRAFKCITKLVQNIGSVPLASPVIERVESWVGDTGHLLEFVARQTLAFKNFL